VCACVCDRAPCHRTIWSHGMKKSETAAAMYIIARSPRGSRPRAITSKNYEAKRRRYTSTA
jgi:hypothetical protein